MMPKVVDEKLASFCSLRFDDDLTFEGWTKRDVQAQEEVSEFLDGKIIKLEIFKAKNRKISCSHKAEFC